MHASMFGMARAMHYRLAGRPMGAGMLWGMAFIVAGGAAEIAVPVLLGLALIAVHGEETREARSARARGCPMTRWSD